MHFAQKPATGGRSFVLRFFIMEKLGLPPKVGEIANGSVTWEGLEDFDYELSGYFLSCHLVIEHYMQEYLKIVTPT